MSFEIEQQWTIPPGHDHVWGFSLAGGKPLYAWKDRHPIGSRVVHGDDVSPPYYRVGSPQWRSGKPLYTVVPTDRGECEHVIWGCDTGIEYPFVVCLGEEDGKLVFFTRYVGARHQSFVQFGDDRGPEFNEIYAHDFQVAGGAPLYAARRGTDSFMVWGNREYTGLRPDFPEGFRFACGRPVYEGFDSEGRWFHAWGDDRFPGGEKYVTFEKFTVVGCRPLRWGRFDGRQRMFWGEDEVPIPGGRVLTRPVLFRGKLCFLADRTFEDEVIVWGDQVIDRYRRIAGLAFKDDQPLFHAWRYGRHLLVHGEVEYEVAAGVNWSDVIGGVPFGTARILHPRHHGGEDDRYTTVVVHGKARSDEYDDIFSLTTSGTTIEFGARKGNRLFRVVKSVDAPH